MGRLSACCLLIALALSACAFFEDGPTRAENGRVDDEGRPAGAGAALALVDPPETCVALRGEQPWVVVFQPDPPVPCLIVGEEQRVEIFNKGLEPTTISWDGEDRAIGSDDSFLLGRADRILQPGPTTIDGTPYRVPTLWLLARDRSPTAGVPLRDGRFGRIAPGMTVAEAEAASGLTLQLEDALPDPDCRSVFVARDPYSPLFVVTGPDEELEIIRIVDELPDGGPCP